MASPLRFGAFVVVSAAYSAGARRSGVGTLKVRNERSALRVFGGELMLELSRGLARAPDGLNLDQQLSLRRMQVLQQNAEGSVWWKGSVHVKKDALAVGLPLCAMSTGKREYCTSFVPAGAKAAAHSGVCSSSSAARTILATVGSILKR
jgi:hypothetical protein